ncbi:MAG TPA: DUF3592 domain-containing protein [bacterium]|nr:DUF3592 domain-containing protein [bacterium]
MPADGSVYESLYIGLGIAGLIMGPFMLWCGLDASRDDRRSRRIARESPHWPVAIGIVTTSEVREVHGDGGDGFAAGLVYEYEVAGQRYSASAINAATIATAGTPEGVERILEPYPVGAQVGVFYNPARPEECVLQPGMEPAAFGLGVNAGCGPGLVVFGIALTIGGMVAVVLALTRDNPGP